jgi:cytochrome c oxidase cbb3-type subunit I
MSATFSSSEPPVPAVGPVASVATAEIDASCRIPLLVLLISAAIWAVVASAFALISSIKFHSPNFLADTAWLTYGRVRPAFLDSFLYGFCVQAGLGVAVWILARLGRNRLVNPALFTVGGALWNLGVTVGVAGILLGDATGFEKFDLPRYAHPILFLGYLLLGTCGVLTFHRRKEKALFPSQWFLFTALFWFPWIFSTASLLLSVFPVRGVTQSVIAWWFANNLVQVWLGLVGLAAGFYFFARLTGRELHSHYLALLAFWSLVLFDSWGGIPGTAPVPAWIPTLSTVGTVLGLLTVLAVALNLHYTGGMFGPFIGPSFCFVRFGLAAFVLAGLMRILGAVFDFSQTLQFTWFVPATSQFHWYGFFSLIMFGAAYTVLPQIMGTALLYPKLVRVHFFLAAAGTLLVIVPLAAAGILEAIKLQNPAIAFIDISKSSLMPLRVSTIGDLLIAAGHVLFLVNVVALPIGVYRARATAAYAFVTAPLQPAEVKP